MFSARSLLLLAALALVPAPVSAHADASESVYDPLALDFPGFLASDGHILPAAPDAAQVYFPAYAPGAAASHLDFVMAAPVRFAPVNGLSVRAHVVADKPSLGGDGSTDGFVVSLLADGQPVKGARRTVSVAPSAFLVPGSSFDVATVVQAPDAVFARGSLLTLRIEPTMASLSDSSLKVTVGGASASRADFLGARLPSLDDLALTEPPGATLFLLANTTFHAPEASAAIVTLSVKHNETTLLSRLDSAPLTYVVLRGDESVNEGRAFHEAADPAARNDAAHLYRVGPVRVRVHPGVGVAVRLTPSASSVTDIVCERGCPAAGFKAQLGAPPASATSSSAGSDQTSILIPPPRATTGIPVSKDAPAQKAAPGFEVTSLAAAAFVAGALAGRVKQRL